MKHVKIPDPEGKGSFSIFSSEDVEYADPIKYFLNSFVTTHFIDLKETALLKFPSIHPNSLDEPILEKSAAFAEKFMKGIISTPIPENLVSLIKSTSKKEQQKLLKGFSLTTDELLSFICNAWTQHGFSFSEYIVEHQPKGFENKQLPRLAHKNADNEIKSIGKTSLTNGEIKNLIDHRSITVSKFIDKGDVWHCFFLTYKSLKGEEAGEKPHLHYISSAWGLPRKQVLVQLKSKSYSLPSLPHIDFHTHRNPRQ